MADEREESVWSDYLPDEEAGAADGPSRDEALRQMEEELQDVEDERDEDRFLFVIIVMIAIDAHIFSGMDSWGGPVAILVLEVFALVMLARRLGIETIDELLDRIINGIKNGRGS